MRFANLIIAGCALSSGIVASAVCAQSVPQDGSLRASTTMGDGVIVDRFGGDGSGYRPAPSRMDDGDAPTRDDVRIEEAETKAPPPPKYVGNTRHLARGDVIVDPTHHMLYVGIDASRMRAFPVAVGRRGAAWHGVAKVGFKTVNPTWRPTAHMQKLKHVKAVVEPGPSNPLGVRALYLFQNGHDTLYRIHGTNQPSSIGKSVSHGCIRMRNSDVVQLYAAVPVGATVTVL